MPGAITQVDWNILNWIQEQLQCSFGDWIFPYISALGDGGFLWLIIAAVLLCRRPWRKQGVLLLIGLAAGFLLVNLLLKPLVARPRPSWLAEVALLVENPTDYSFPSGHTASSFIAAFILLAKWKKAGTAAVGVASLIAFSRLYLCVHFPSDVIASVLLAALLAGGVLLVAKNRSSRT